MAAIQHLYVYPIRSLELSVLSGHERASFALICFIVNEVNVLRRLCLLSLEIDKSPAVAMAEQIQRNFLLRTMTARLFEFLKTFDSILTSSKSSKKTKETLGAFSDEIEAFGSGRGFEIARTIRDKFSNHFDIGYVSRQMEKNQIQNYDCGLYLCDETGNSYFAIGENAVFSYGIYDLLDASGKSENPLEHVDAWIDWCINLSECVNRVQLAIFLNLIEPLFPKRNARQRIEWIDESLVAPTKGHRLPLFLRDVR